MDTSEGWGCGCGCITALTFLLGVIWLIIYAFNGMTHSVKIVGLVFIIIVALFLIDSIIELIVSLFE